MTKYLDVFVRIYYGYCLAATTLTAFCKSDSLEFISLLRWRSLPMLIYSLQKVIYFSTRSAVDRSLWRFCSRLRINKIANAFSSYFIFKHFYRRFFFIYFFRRQKQFIYRVRSKSLFFRKHFAMQYFRTLNLYFYVQVFFGKNKHKKKRDNTCLIKFLSECQELKRIYVG